MGRGKKLIKAISVNRNELAVDSSNSIGTQICSEIFFQLLSLYEDN